MVQSELIDGMSEAGEVGVAMYTRPADRDQSHGVEYLVAVLGHGSLWVPSSLAV